MQVNTRDGKMGNIEDENYWPLPRCVCSLVMGKTSSALTAIVLFAQYALDGIFVDFTKCLSK